MTFKFVATLAVLPLLVVGFQRDIRVSIHVDKGDIAVTLSGNHTRLIDDIALRQFAITHDRLLAGAQRLAGSRPDQVFLRDPTGNLGNQFEINGWEQTTAVLKPIAYRDTEVHHHSPIYDAHFFHNSADKLIRVHANYDTNIEEYGNNTWSGVPRILQVDPNINIRYSVGYGQWLPIDYSGRWGERSDWSRGSQHVSGVRFNLRNPGDSNVRLVSSRVTARVNIVYRSSLQGKAIGYWRRGHEGRQFWAFDINNVLWEGGMLLQVDSIEHVNAHFRIGELVEPFL